MYATQQDIIDRYGQAELLLVADRDGDGAADPDVVNKALADATGKIDSYLAARYPLPLATVPQVLVEACVELALYKMAADGGTESDQRRRRYEDTLAWLKELARGIASLGLEQAAPTVGGAVTVSGSGRLFTRDKMQGL